MSDAPAPDERFLDLRGLEPPEPLVRIFAALDESPGLPLRARLSREPFPLYPMLLAGGWRRRTERYEDGSCDVVITRNGAV